MIDFAETEILLASAFVDVLLIQISAFQYQTG